MSLKELILMDSSPKMKLICQAIKFESSSTAGLCTSTGLIAGTKNGTVPVWTGNIKIPVLFKF